MPRALRSWATATVQPTTGSVLTLNYVLGDIFHADPVLVDRPNDFLAFTANLHGDTSCGYQCFAKQESRRRKMLLVGANDGQLHVFDAGVWQSGTKTFSVCTPSSPSCLISDAAHSIARCKDSDPLNRLPIRSVSHASRLYATSLVKAAPMIRDARSR